MCCDEISTGLDAATTFDICKLMGDVNRMMGTIKLVSLLQPPPETVALFDELILIDSGRVIYSGPVDSVVHYFESLGYFIPERMDVADWLQQLPTKDGKKYMKDGADPLTTEQFQQRFDESAQGKAIRDLNKEPLPKEYQELQQSKRIKTYYHNSGYNSLKLLVRREMILWWRDKYQIKARLMQDVVMGIVAGTVFWQENDDPQSVMG